MRRADHIEVFVVEHHVNGQTSWRSVRTSKPGEDQNIKVLFKADITEKAAIYIMELAEKHWNSEDKS
jgi:hypothetical protein